jgi:hypothetical protein
MSASNWLKKVFDIALDKTLPYLVTTVFSGALLFGLWQKLKLPVPLWVVVAALPFCMLLGASLPATVPLELWLQ